MKKIIVSLLVIGAAAASLAAGTYAWFSSTKTISGNTLATGTLEVGLTGNGAGATTFDLGSVKLEPGGETGEASIQIKNNGTINLGWFGYFNFGGYDALQDKVFIKEATMEFFKPESGTWEPTDNFIHNGVGGGLYPSFFNTLAANDPIHKISLRSWNSAANDHMGAGGGIQMGALKPGYSYRLTFKLGLDGTADNSYQNKSLSISYTVASTQINAEALEAIGDPDPRIDDSASDHVAWMTAQIAKQP